MRQRLLAIMRKEWIHIRRDPRTLLVVFLLPLALMFLIGYALDMDLKHAPLAIVDHSRTPFTRELTARLEAAGRFRVARFAASEKEAVAGFGHREYRAVLVFPSSLARDGEKSGRAWVQALIDGADANSAALVQNDLAAFFQNINLEQLRGFALELRPLILYNPDLESTHFIIPGLVAILLMMICAMLTSITVAREKETGTMEQILVSPVQGREIIVGKLLPYVGLGLANAIFVLVLGRAWFGVPLRGSLAQLALFALIYICAALAFGLLISTRAHSQQVAMMTALIATMLPSMMLSGFVFPIASMPRLLQGLTNLVPARHFVTILRGVALQGVGLESLWPSALFLAAFSALLTFIAIRRFSTKLSPESR